jgi:hypothetical protein
VPELRGTWVKPLGTSTLGANLKIKGGSRCRPGAKPHGKFSPFRKDLGIVQKIYYKNQYSNGFSKTGPRVAYQHLNLHVQ